MGNMQEIKDLLLSGKTAIDIIGQGYAKSTVYSVVNSEKSKLKPAVFSSDEISELKHRREVIRLEQEIAELEAREKIPGRIAKLESELEDMDSLIWNVAGKTLYTAMVVIGEQVGIKVNTEAVFKYCKDWVQECQQ